MFKEKLTPLTIALVYALLGATWIYFSDNVLGILVEGQTRYLSLQTAKGGLYVVVTATLLYILIDRSTRALVEAKENQRRSAERLRNLHEIDRAILEARSLEEIAHNTLARVRELVLCTRASVVVFDWEAEEATTFATHVNGETSVPADARGPLEAFTNVITELRHGKTRIVEDLQALSRSTPIDRMLQGEGVRSYVMVPLLAEGELIGTLNLGADTPGGFSSEDVRIVGEVADILAVAFQQARIKESLQQSVAEIQNLQDITRALLELEELAEVMHAVAEGIVTHLAYDMVIVSRYVAEQSAFVGSAFFPVTELSTEALDRLGYSGLKEKLHQHRLTYQAGLNPFLDRVLDGEVVTRNSLADFLKPWVPQSTAEELQNYFEREVYIDVPMQVGEKTVGTILAGARKGPITPGQQQALMRVADQAAVAIENARLFAETSQALERERRLTEVAHTINSTLELPTLLNTIVQLAVELVGADFGGLALIEPDGQSMTYPYLYNLPRGLSETPIPEGQGLAWQVAESGESVRLNDYSSYSRALSNWVTAGVRTAVMVPVTVGDTCIGALGVGGFSAETQFSDRDLAVAEAVGRQAGVAIQNARLYAAEQARRQELDTLYGLSRRLVAIHELSAVLDTIARHTVETVHVTFCRITLRERGQYVCRAAHPIRPLDFDLGVGRVAPWTAARQYQRVLRDNRPLVLARAETDLEEKERQTLLLNKVETVCLIPLRVGEKKIGVMALGEARHLNRTPFDADKLNLITSIAEQAASAIQRARLHEELEESYVETVLALANAMDARDTYTGNHSQRLAEWAVATARELGCSLEEIRTIEWGALLHDIGKIGVPDSILLKEGPLTQDEWKVIERHPDVGAGIVAPVKRLEDVAPIIRAHQEKYDGTGYPDGLRGDKIPLGARILAVVDAYGAITDKRPYQEARPHEEAVAELERCAGTQFDPQVVEAFLRALERRVDIIWGGGEKRFWRRWCPELER